LPEDYKEEETKGIAFIIALSFYRYLEIKCCLICDYVSKAKDEADVGLNNSKHDKLICDILWEAFEL